MTSRPIRNGLAAAAGALAFIAPAHAALTYTGVSCSGQSTAIPSIADYVACAGSFSGNNSNQSQAVDDLIEQDWHQQVSHTIDITGSEANATSGTLHFTAQTSEFVIALKAGNAFSLYEFDASVSHPITSIQFDTLGVGFFSGNANHRQEHDGQGLSHADIYELEPECGDVPEPATAPLMLAGLGALVAGFARRRQTTR